MLFDVTTLEDEELGILGGGYVWADSEDQAKDIYAEKSGTSRNLVIKAKHDEGTHKEFLDRGISIGNSVFGDHPYEHGGNITYA